MGTAAGPGTTAPRAPTGSDGAPRPLRRRFESALAAACTGSPEAYTRIFTALAPVVEGYLRLQGASEPEDLTSEVFLAVLRNLRTFEGDEPGFRSWVFTIAHRRLVDERRRAVR